MISTFAGLIGVTGALEYWAPLQPVLGLASVALLAVGLWRRLRGERSCAVSAMPLPSYPAPLGG